MSYPGANGLSFADSDLEANADIKRLLHDATAEGFLLQRDHTPKSLTRGKSVKWYVHPVLAPYYELTVPHTKEPLYLPVAEFREWMERRTCYHRKARPRHRERVGLLSPPAIQMHLFDDAE